MTIGGRVRELREQKGLSQQGLADRAGMGRAHLTRLEGGKRAPRWDTIEKLAAALSCAATDLFPTPISKPAPLRTGTAIPRRRGSRKVA